MPIVVEVALDAHIADNLWVILCAFLVFFMHAGFSLLECGLCRRRNAASILVKNFLVVALGSVAYYLVGFGVMFGDGGPLAGVLAAGPPTSANVPAGLSADVFVFFQLVFAATAATIVSGAVAERTRIEPFFLVTALITALIYPLVGHWVWGGGFLGTWGFHDFAGSTVVHAVGGAIALVGAISVGARRGRFRPDGTGVPIPGHSLPLAALGTLVLWFGWFGFNGGSTLAADPRTVGSVILATNLAGAAGALAAIGWVWWRHGALDLAMGLNGALAGLVAITAGADVIAPAEALVVGALGALVAVGAVRLLDRLRIDDPVGAVPVHLGGGLFGTLAVGLFSHAPGAPGLFHGGGVASLVVQGGGALACIAFAGAAGSLAWGIARVVTGGLRVSVEHELEGLDLHECGGPAYPPDVVARALAEPATVSAPAGRES